MEEMQNLNVEDTITEVVEVATDKLTFKENILAYSLAGIFVTGLTTIGYLGYKGTKKLVKNFKDKREVKVVAEEAPVEDINTEYHKHEYSEEKESE
jgi:hypothetical protein